MIRRGKTSWKCVQVYADAGSDEERSSSIPPGWAGGAEDLDKLDTTERLVALYHLQNGERTGARFYRFLDDGRSDSIREPEEIDWEGFPVLAALEAITYDELRRLRGLLRSDFPPAL
jgi:hypothetical protein